MSNDFFLLQRLFEFWYQLHLQENEQIIDHLNKKLKNVEIINYFNINYKSIEKNFNYIFIFFTFFLSSDKRNRLTIISF